jgi:hypothetical protein
MTSVIALYGYLLRRAEAGAREFAHDPVLLALYTDLARKARAGLLAA